jgi:hypothetical protein
LLSRAESTDAASHAGSLLEAVVDRSAAVDPAVQAGNGGLVGGGKRLEGARLEAPIVVRVVDEGERT